MVVESQTTDYNIRIYVGNDCFAAFKISQEEWESGDVSDVIDDHIGYRPREKGETEEEYRIIKDAVEDFAELFSKTGDALVGSSKETGIRPIFRTENYGEYGVVPSEEIPSSFPKPATAEDYEIVTEVESRLWPIPVAVATINEKGYKEEDECLWARPELIACLWRMQSELLNESGYSSLAEMAADERVAKAAGGEENVGKIAINSLYRRLNTPVLGGKYPDREGKLDKGDSTGPGHWTGYAVDIGRVRTAKRFGFRGTQGQLWGIVKEAAINAGLVAKAKRGSSATEPHHFRPADEYMLSDWQSK